MRIEKKVFFAVMLCGVWLCASGCANAPAKLDLDALRQEATIAEIAFAKSMADRDLDAFSRFIADDAIFLNDNKPLRGKAAVIEHWQRFFKSEKAPFSWRPDLVEVPAARNLALSTGPVFNADGKLIARFNSTWRLESPGVWRVVFDSGCDLCDCAKP
jgi:ketosteroid isomerase-like protein